MDGLTPPLSSGLTSDGRPRHTWPDVTRALALSGVVAMNFHTYLNGSGASSPMNASVWERLFNPNTGPLTTRFAAVFVCVAGIAVALMERSWVGTSRALSARLLRRGFVLYAAGFALEWIWPGTIIFYYGAYFMLAAILIHLSSRQLLALCVPIALVAALIQGVRAERLADGDFTSWLDPVSITSLTDLMVRTFVSYTHPVFPWLVFLCVGIVVGRNMEAFMRYRLRFIVLGVSLMTVAYVARDLVNHLAATADNAAFMLMVSSTDPKSGGMTYTIGTVGSTLVCIVLISHLCDRWQQSSIITALARIGRTSLTFYVFHVFFYETVVEMYEAVSATGLDTALVLSIACIVLGSMLVLWWTRFIGQGPFERLYRLLAP